MNRKRSRERREATVEAARKQVGYRSQPERRSAFTDRTEHTGKPWNGVFLQYILTTAFNSEPEVNFVSTVTALGYYVQRNGVRTKVRTARPGDIVFFNFATDPARWYEQPHAGVVTEISSDGSFRTVEGETGPGVPQGSQLVDGVFERVRYQTDVLGFVRPAPRKAASAAVAEPARLRMSYFESNGKTVARAVETVQVALNRVRPAWSFNRGKRDGLFKSTLGLYGRETGTVTARGEIEPRVLKRLADDTDLVLDS